MTERIIIKGAKVHNLPCGFYMTKIAEDIMMHFLLIQEGYNTE